MPVDFQGDAANGPTAGTQGQPTKLGRILLFIGGVGMLCAPVTYFIANHNEPAGWNDTNCAWYAEHPDPTRDLAALGCPTTEEF